MALSLDEAVEAIIASGGPLDARGLAPAPRFTAIRLFTTPAGPPPACAGGT